MGEVISFENYKLLHKKISKEEEIDKILDKLQKEIDLNKDTTPNT